LKSFSTVVRRQMQIDSVRQMHSLNRWNGDTTSTKAPPAKEKRSTSRKCSPDIHNHPSTFLQTCAGHLITGGAVFPEEGVPHPLGVPLSAVDGRCQGSGRLGAFPKEGVSCHGGGKHGRISPVSITAIWLTHGVTMQIISCQTHAPDEQSLLHSYRPL